MTMPEEVGLAPCREEPPASPGKISKASFLAGQALMFYAALVSASTPVATRYLYRTPHPPQPAVLSCVQTTFAAAILILICGAARVIGRACATARGPPAPPAAAPAPAPAKRVAVRRDDMARREAPLAAEGEVCKAAAGGGGGAAADCEAASGGGKRQASTRGAPRHSPGPGAGPDRAGSASVCLLERGGSAFSLESEGLHYGHRRSSTDLGLGPRGVQKGWEECAWRRCVAAGYETARRPVARLLNHRTRSLRAAGVELGLLAFTANAVMVYGFTMTTVGRGAFLIRASIIFTPILSTLAGERVPRGLWAGAVVGFVGSVMISLDPVKKDGGHSTGGTAMQGRSAVLGGDLLLLGSACLWSMVMVRQSAHAPHFSAMSLATIKLITMSIASTAWLVVAIINEVGHHKPATAVWEGFRDPISWLVLLWPAIGPFSTAEIAQIAAQRRISAAAGQVILAIDPVFSIALGFAVDRGETQLGPLGWAGGATLIAACLLASRWARAH